jgi:hypothetical protein
MHLQDAQPCSILTTSSHRCPDHDTTAHRQPRQDSSRAQGDTDTAFHTTTDLAQDDNRTNRTSLVGVHALRVCRGHGFAAGWHAVSRSDRLRVSRRRSHNSSDELLLSHWYNAGDAGHPSRVVMLITQQFFALYMSLNHHSALYVNC